MIFIWQDSIFISSCPVTIDQLDMRPVSPPSEHVTKCFIEIKRKKEFSRERTETVGEQIVSICWVRAVFDMLLPYAVSVQGLP